ncbi:MAG: type I-E CRISPR-associated protein Cas6/Cse3/CasE [Thermoanaerobaculia bacterium]
MAAPTPYRCRARRWQLARFPPGPAPPPRPPQRRRQTPGAVPERPDALLTGTLEVTDPDAFATLLARGVGRHRAFGFGMLLLRPPGSGAR